MSWTSHCPIVKWVPNPSEYFPPRLSPTVTCKIVVLALKTWTPHSPDFYCPAGEQMHSSAPSALLPNSLGLHAPQMGVSAWLTTMDLLWQCNLKTYMPCKWLLPHLLQWTGALRRRIRFQVGPSLGTFSYSKEFCLYYHSFVMIRNFYSKYLLSKLLCTISLQPGPRMIHTVLVCKLSKHSHRRLAISPHLTTTCGAQQSICFITAWLSLIQK